MKRDDKALLTAGIVIIAIAIVLNWSSIAPLVGLQSILGEEGYNPYDSLLVSGAYDQSVWQYNLPGCAAVDGARRTACEAGSREWNGVSVKDGAIYISSGVGEPEGNGRYLRTQNLRSKNFRANYVVVANVNKNLIVASSSLATNKGIIYTSPSKYAGGGTAVFNVAVELLWDDYETNHYIITVNGVVAQEGNIGPGDELYFILAPDPTWGWDDLGTTVGFQNPRYKELFGCSLGANEYLIGRTFANGEDFNIANLRGFKRFCLETPSLFMNAGNVTSSKQVYYHLASGGTVAVADDQIRKVFYIGDGAFVGVPPNECVGSAYDYSKKDCTSLTGIVDVCPTGQLLSNGACVVQVESEIVLTNASSIVGNNKVQWSSNYLHPSLMSGAYSLVDGSSPTYTCQASDDHTDMSAMTYPEPSPSCYVLKANGLALVPASENVLNDYLSIKPVDVKSRVYYDASNNLVGEYRKPRDWQVTYVTTLTKMPFVASLSTALAYELGSKESFTVNVNSGLGTVSGLVQTFYTDSVGTTTVVVPVKITNGANSFNVPINAAHVGQASAQVLVLLSTDAGSLQASDVKTFAYTVSTGQSYCPSNSLWNNSTGRCESKQLTSGDCPVDHPIYDAVAKVCYFQIDARCPAGSTVDSKANLCVYNTTVNVSATVGCKVGFTLSNDQKTCYAPVTYSPVEPAGQNDNLIIVGVLAVILLVIWIFTRKR